MATIVRDDEKKNSELPIIINFIVEQITFIMTFFCSPARRPHRSLGASYFSLCFSRHLIFIIRYLNGINQYTDPIFPFF